MNPSANYESPIVRLIGWWIERPLYVVILMLACVSVALPRSYGCELPANLKRKINGLSGIDLADEFVKDPIRRFRKRSNKRRPGRWFYRSLLID